MDILFNMRAFVSVAETGSFTAAAQRLDLTTAYVSRAVAKLRPTCRPACCIAPPGASR